MESSLGTGEWLFSSPPPSLRDENGQCTRTCIIWCAVIGEYGNQTSQRIKVNETERTIHHPIRLLHRAIHNVIDRFYAYHSPWCHTTGRCSGLVEIVTVCGSCQACLVNNPVFYAPSGIWQYSNYSSRITVCFLKNTVKYHSSATDSLLSHHETRLSWVSRTTTLNYF